MDDKKRKGDLKREGDFVPLAGNPLLMRCGVVFGSAESWPGGAGPTLQLSRNGEVMDAELNPKELLNRILQLKEHL